MYEYVRGRVVKKLPTSVVVEAGGVGFLLETSLRTSGALALGKDATVLVHHRPSEDAVRLFGFATDEERDLFRRLLRTSGVGPAHALALCSAFAPDQVWRALAAGDEKRLTATKGVGPKIAQRLFAELRDEAERRGYGAGGAGASDASSAPAAGAADDAVDALLVLGYTEAAALKVVAAARKKIGAGADVADVVKEALRAGG